MTNHNPSFSAVISAPALLLALAAGVHAAPIDSRFQPDDYTTGSSLSLTSGDSITFDTSGGNPSYSGTVSGSGVADTSEGGGVELAIFAFDDIDIASGVTVNVTGNRGIVLASKSDIDFGSTMSVNGGTPNDNSTSGAAGGPGAEGGVPTSSFSSAPPSNDRGDGGNAFNDGVGYGGGQMSSNQGDFIAGCGGGYGGAGGDGFVGSITSGQVAGGGVAYGDEMLTELYGGSGGSGSTKNDGGGEYGGGGGGGAISLTANGTINLSGALEAIGGTGAANTSGVNGLAGGGGSGGGILLNADILNLTGTIDVSGGDGGDQTVDGSPTTARHGAAGGGGRVALYYLSTLTNNATIAISGGASGWTNTQAQGTDGTLSITVIPEPASAVLLVVGGVVLLRRRRR